jgi:hypothetical protein
LTGISEAPSLYRTADSRTRSAVLRRFAFGAFYQVHDAGIVVVDSAVPQRVIGLVRSGKGRQ